jgi:hypothetical protein
MAKSLDMMDVLILAGGAYLIYHYLSPTQVQNIPSGAGSIMCKFPNGMTTVQNADGTCPFDGTKGGQSTPCAGPGFVGPLQPGMNNC